MYHFPNDSAGQQAKELYESSLFNNFRFADAKIDISVAYQGSQPNTHRWNHGILDNGDIVGNNFVYEASATPNNTFGLGAVNVDTVTLDVLYSSQNAEILDDIDADVVGDEGSYSNAEFYIQLGYGHESPYTDSGYIAGKTALVPLGTFVMQEKACKVGENKYTLKLQSLITRFDRDLPAVFNSTNNSVMTQILQDRGIQAPDLLAILEWCCHYVPRTGYWDSNGDFHYATRMQLSSKMDMTTAEGRAYVASIPNLTGHQFTISQDTGYLTYRDIVKDIATLCCSFATTDEVGNLLLVPFAPMTELCERLNDGITQDTTQTPTVDICTKYQENLGVFKIKQIKCLGTIEEQQGGQTVEVEADYSRPTQYTGTPNYYDITGTKLLVCIDDPNDIVNVVDEIANSILYNTVSSSNLGAANYRPIPFDIETASGDFRLRLGDWVSCISNFSDRLGNKFYCKAQIMRMTLRLNGKARYQSFVLPSDNDRNASKRQSEAQGDYPTPEGGEAPPPPEPPVVIMDDMGQWLFGDEEGIREEYEAVGEPGRTYYVSQVGQWSFNNTAL